jgi:hypothetical protein
LFKKTERLDESRIDSYSSRDVSTLEIEACIYAIEEDESDWTGLIRFWDKIEQRIYGLIREGNGGMDSDLQKDFNHGGIPSPPD